MRRLMCWGGVLALVFVVQAEALELKGELTQGALIRGEVPAGSRVLLGEQPIRTAPDGRFVLGFDRDAPTAQRVRVITPDGQTETHELVLTAREYAIQRIEGVPEKTVNPPKEQMERIRKESLLVKAAREGESDLDDVQAAFIWPSEGRISGVYGSQRFYNGEARQPHWGVDVAAAKGAPVVAPAGGIVRLAEPDLFFSGGTLIIDHGLGVTSTFLHLDKILVKPGQRVEQGDLIARVGASGRATGPHLDWRMNWHDVRVDPATLAPALHKGRTPPLVVRKATGQHASHSSVP